VFFLSGFTSSLARRCAGRFRLRLDPDIALGSQSSENWGRENGRDRIRHRPEPDHDLWPNSDGTYWVEFRTADGESLGTGNAPMNSSAVTENSSEDVKTNRKTGIEAMHFLRCFPCREPPVLQRPPKRWKYFASSGRAVRNADQVQLQTRPDLRKTIKGQIPHSKSESPVAISTCAISAFQSYCLARSRSFTSHQQHTPGVLRLTNRNFRICSAAPDGNKHGNDIQLASHTEYSRGHLPERPATRTRRVSWLDIKSNSRLGRLREIRPRGGAIRWPPIPSSEWQT
jgi:hypothetical protein